MAFKSIIVLTFKSNLKLKFSGVNNANKILNNDHSILCHLPFKEILKEKLVFIEPYIEVHIDMNKSLLKMRDDSKTWYKFYIPKWL